MGRLIVFLLICFVWIFDSRSSLYAQSPYSVGDMVFCIDASGSMLFMVGPTVPDWTDPANCPTCCDPSDPSCDPSIPAPDGTRWYVAKSAFEQIMSDLDDITELDPDNYPASGWVGIVQFPAQIPGTTPSDYSQIFLDPQVIPADELSRAGFFDGLHDEISNFHPRIGVPGTPIADGLEHAKRLFVEFDPSDGTIPNHEPNERAIFLFTDGENNQPPWFPSQSNTPEFDLANYGLGVYPIGFGNPADLASTNNVLRDLAVETGTGNPYYYNPNPSIEAPIKYLVEDIIKLIREQVLDALQFAIVVDPIFALKAGESRSFDIYVCEYDTTMFLTTHHAAYKNIKNPIVNVRISDSLVINAENVDDFEDVRHSKKGHSQSFVFGNNFVKKYLGKWQATISALDSGVYDFSSFAREGLGFNINTNIADVQTGDRIVFEMRFSPGVVNEESLFVNLNKEEPVIGLGNLFVENLLNKAQMDTVFSAQGNPNITPASYKYRYLLNQVAIPSPSFKNLTVVFNDKGIDGDKVADDGVFTWVTESVLIPDIYKFVFDVQGKTSGNHEFSRSKTIHIPVSVRVVPDWSVSTIKFKPLDQRDDGGNKIGEIRIQLRDLSGNIVGPGFERDLRISISEDKGNRLRGPIQNDLEGNYTQRISYQPGSQPVLSVSFQDLNFPEFEVPVSRWALSLHYGLSFPQQDFKDLYKDDAQTFVVDLDYYFKGSPWMLSLLFGHNRFEGKSSAIPDNALVSLNLAVRYQFNYRGALSPFIEAGPSYYIFENTDDEFGANVGIGIDYRVSPKVSFEFASAYHFIFAGQDFQFIQTRAGVLYHF